MALAPPVGIPLEMGTVTQLRVVPLTPSARRTAVEGVCGRHWGPFPRLFGRKAPREIPGATWRCPTESRAESARGRDLAVRVAAATGHL